MSSKRHVKKCTLVKRSTNVALTPVLSRFLFSNSFFKSTTRRSGILRFTVSALPTIFRSCSIEIIHVTTGLQNVVMQGNDLESVMKQLRECGFQRKRDGRTGNGSVARFFNRGYFWVVNFRARTGKKVLYFIFYAFRVLTYFFKYNLHQMQYN